MRHILAVISLFLLCSSFNIAQTTLDLPQLIPFKYKANFGYKNSNNQIIINPIYQNVGLFVNGKAIVSKDINGIRLSGVIDTNGIELVPIKYRLSSSIYMEGRSMAADGFIDTKACFTIVMDEYKQTNSIGVWDRNGDVIIDADFTSIHAEGDKTKGLFFVAKKRIGTDELIAVYNTVGTCLLPLGSRNNFYTWENDRNGKSPQVILSQEQILQADTSHFYLYIKGLYPHGFSMPHAVIKDKKTALYGVYNLKTKKYILPPSYRYIGTIGRGFLVCTLLEKKRKTIVLNNQYHVIDTLTEKNDFTYFYGSQFAYNHSGIIYSGNYKQLNKQGNPKSRFTHFPNLGLMLIIDRHTNKALVFDTLGKSLFESILPNKYLFDDFLFDDLVQTEIKGAKSVESLLKVMDLAFAPLAETSLSKTYRTSLDGQIYYGSYGGKLIAVNAQDVEKYVSIKRYEVKQVFECLNGKQIPLPEDLRYLLIFGNDTLFAAKHITSPEFFSVDKSGNLTLLSANERTALISRVNSNITPLVNNCSSCSFKNPILFNQNWIWEYQAFSSDNIKIPLPNLVPQANPSSYNIDLSKGQSIFYHRTTMQVYGTFKNTPNTVVLPTPYYNLFRINKKNGDLKEYQIIEF
jgi:hypothetical protein